MIAEGMIKCALNVCNGYISIIWWNLYKGVDGKNQVSSQIFHFCYSYLTLLSQGCISWEVSSQFCASGLIHFYDELAWWKGMDVVFTNFQHPW